MNYILNPDLTILKNKYKRRKKMGQVIEKKENHAELEELFIFLLKKVSKRREEDIEVKKQYELYNIYKNLNPRYFENQITLKDSKLKIQSSDIIQSSKFCLFGSY